MELEDKGLQGVHNDMLPQTESVEAELEEGTSEDGEIGEVLQTSQVVMNMLDVTMPGTLKEAEKQKVRLNHCSFFFSLMYDHFGF